MKAIISSTYDNRYLYFLPITTWLWNKLGVDVICFMPEPEGEIDLLGYKVDQDRRYALINNTILANNLSLSVCRFNALRHKQATYAQCSRLYGACLDLPEDEQLIIGDIDLAPFKVPPTNEKGFTIFGSDLVPEGQYPMCFISAKKKYWNFPFRINYGQIDTGKGTAYTVTHTYQELLDNLLGDIECENMRGNYWSKDQQTAFEKISALSDVHLVPRARPGTQFATNRVDRDDINWRAYVNDELVDAHLWRDGFTEQNHANIMELLQMKYPNENFNWLVEYTEKYKQLL